MIALFTTSIYPLSKAITKVLREPVSHCAIYFPGSDTVYHMSFGGLKRESLVKFAEKNVIHFELPLENHTAFFEAYLEFRLWRDFKESSYDYPAFLAIGLRALGLWPKKVNLVNLTGSFLCTELVEVAIDGKEDKEMLTPYKLYLKLLANSSTNKKG